MCLTFVAAVVFASLFAAPAAAHVRVAVLGLETEGVPGIVEDTVRIRLARELHGRPTVDVTSLDAADAVCRTTGDCCEEVAVARAGRVLGADKVVFGRMRKGERGVDITLRLVDVESEREDFGVTGRLTGGQVLQQFIEEFADRVARTSRRTVLRPDLADEFHRTAEETEIEKPIDVIAYKVLWYEDNKLRSAWSSAAGLVAGGAACACASAGGVTAGQQLVLNRVGWFTLAASAGAAVCAGYMGCMEKVWREEARRLGIHIVRRDGAPAATAARVSLLASPGGCALACRF